MYQKWSSFVFNKNHETFEAKNRLLKAKNVDFEAKNVCLRLTKVIKNKHF